jgi:hypothetical protein
MSFIASDAYIASSGSEKSATSKVYTPSVTAATTASSPEPAGVSSDI